MQTHQVYINPAKQLCWELEIPLANRALRTWQPWMCCLLAGECGVSELANLQTIRLKWVERTPLEANGFLFCFVNETW